MPRVKLHNYKLKKYSKALRQNQTEEERKLWFNFLKNLPIQFNRQVTILKYIVDFCCPSKKIVIELDGSQHYFDDIEHNDRIRDEQLTALGYKVLRYSNADVNLRFNDVCADIYSHISF